MGASIPGNRNASEVRKGYGWKGFDSWRNKTRYLATATLGCQGQ